MARETLEIKSMSTATRENDICALVSPLGLCLAEGAFTFLPIFEWYLIKTWEASWNDNRCSYTQLTSHSDPESDMRKKFSKCSAMNGLSEKPQRSSAGEAIIALLMSEMMSVAISSFFL